MQQTLINGNGINGNGNRTAPWIRSFSISAPSSPAVILCLKCCVTWLFWNILCALYLWSSSVLGDLTCTVSGSRSASSCWSSLLFSPPWPSSSTSTRWSVTGASTWPASPSRTSSARSTTWTRTFSRRQPGLMSDYWSQHFEMLKLQVRYEAGVQLITEREHYGWN